MVEADEQVVAAAELASAVAAGPAVPVATDVEGPVGIG